MAEEKNSANVTLNEWLSSEVTEEEAKKIAYDAKSKGFVGRVTKKMLDEITGMPHLAFVSSYECFVADKELAEEIKKSFWTGSNK